LAFPNSVDVLTDDVTVIRASQVLGPQRITVGPTWYNVKSDQYGATGNGTTDDSPAITAALTAASSTGGIVWVPAGNYAINSQIVIPYGVEMRLVGRNSSFITALGTFPTNTPLVRLGPLGVLGVGSRFRGGAVDCNNITGSTGIYSEGIQENSGIYESMIRNYGAFGARINYSGSGGQPQNWSIDDLEVFSGTGTGSGAIGVAVNTASVSMPFRSIRRVTIFATGSTQLANAMQIQGGSAGLVEEIHIENAVNGIDILGCFATTFESITGNPNVTNLVVIDSTSASQNLTLIGINGQGATNTIVDQETGFTLTNEQAIYAVGNGSTNQRTVVSTDAGLGTRLKIFRRSVQTPSSSASITIDASAGEKVKPSVLAANATINAPTNPSLGQELTFTFIQDGTGGRTVSWNAVFKQSWSDTGNTSNKRSSITFWYDGTNWNQQGAQTPYV